MEQFLTLSRAARLMGVSRSTLQKQIKNGELASFDGMISMSDLRAAYPDARFDEDLFLERIAKIKEEAFAQRVRERTLPDKEVLAARLYEQSRDLADMRIHLERYHAIVAGMQDKLRDMDESAGQTLHSAMQALDQWLERQLEEVLDTKAPHPLDVMNDYLRVMTAHVTLQPSGHDFFVEGSDSILEAALKAGLALNYGCSSGNCGLCKVRVVSGQTAKVRHYDYVLSEAEKIRGYVLACSYTAVSDLIIEALEANEPRDIPPQEIHARVKTVQPLTDKVMLLHLQTPRTNRLRFLAGQSVTLSIGETRGSDYAVASCPCDDRNLQFHIRNIEGDDFAWRVFNGMKSGDTVTVQGPWGDFVLKPHSSRPLLFLTCNSGFAPIKSLIEHAMALDSIESIQLYWLATVNGGHYLANLCRSWADALDNFEYHEVLADSLQEPNPDRMLDQVLADHPDISQFDVYVSGAKPFVAKARDVLLKAGVPAGQLITGIV